MEIDFKGLGWKIKLQERKKNYFITLVKELVLGNLLKKGDELYYYLTDIEGKKALVIMLDKNPLTKIPTTIFNKLDPGQNVGKNPCH